jgi:energy-coupling factor transporter transmembrane protein EcfT
MEFIIFVIFLSLILALFFVKLRKEKLIQLAKLFRIASVIFSISIFTYWFIKKSVVGIVEDSVALQVINKLPQPLDFYVVILNDSEAGKIIETKHIGNIRPEYYRIEYLKMDKSDEYWIVGYLGKKNLVYFSQHALPNKNIDQIIEIQNYINQSVKLSDLAKKQVEAYNYENIKVGIWITLDFLLLFLNLVLLVRKKK